MAQRIVRIGEILIGSSLINTKQLEEALNYAGYKQIPVGRALRTLRFLSEDNLARSIEAQKAIRKGLENKLALAILRTAIDTNRTFNYTLENSPLSLRNVPNLLIESILDKKIPRSLQQQLDEIRGKAGVAMPQPAAAPASSEAAASKPQAPVSARPSTGSGRAFVLDPYAPPAVNPSSQPASRPMNPPSGGGNSLPPSRPSAPTGGTANHMPANPISALSAAAASATPPLPASAYAPSDTKPSAMSGQMQNFDDLIAAGDKLFMANELEQAENTYQKARAQAENSSMVKPTRVATALTKLANLYLSTDRFKEAQPLYERVLEIQLKVFGDATPHVTRALEDLAELYDIQNRLPLAKKYIDEALQNFYKQDLLDIEMGIRLLKRLLSITRRSGEQPSRLRLGELAVDTKLITREQLQTALQQSQQSGMPLGSVLRALNLVDSQKLESLLFAQLLIKQGLMPSTVAVYAIRLSTKNRVPLRQLCESRQVLTEKEITGDLYQQFVLEQEKLLAAELKFGSDNPEVARLAERVADMHLLRNDFLAAEALYKRAISILQKSQAIDKTEAARVCEKLADIHVKNHKFAEAQPLLLKSLEFRQVAGKSESREAATALWQLARIELAQYNHATALSFLRSAKAIFEKLMPGSAPKELTDQISTCCLELGISGDF